MYGQEFAVTEPRRESLRETSTTSTTPYNSSTRQATHRGPLLEDQNHKSTALFRTQIQQVDSASTASAAPQSHT